MSAEPVTVDEDDVAQPKVDIRGLIDAAHKAIDYALTDEDGYRIPPVCEQAPDLWFAEVGGSNADEKAACVGCPALEACGRYAILAGETTGVWGGETGLGRGGIPERLARLLTWRPRP